VTKSAVRPERGRHIPLGREVRGRRSAPCADGL